MQTISIMKKLILSLATATLLFTTMPSQASTEPAPITAPVVSAEVTALLTRLDEIMAMDKSSLNRVEKKELREEVRGIKSELKRLDSAVTLSVGALIIIILLLILLL